MNFFISLRGLGRLLWQRGQITPFGQRFRDLASVLDEKPHDWTRRTVLQGNYSVRHTGQRQVDRQDLNLMESGRASEVEASLADPTTG